MSDLAIRDPDTSNTPTRLSPSALVAIAQRWARNFGSAAGTGQPADHRWYCRLERNASYEVWLLGWNSDRFTDFHDHGGSAGAVKVIAGSLYETRLRDTRGRVQRRRKVETGHTFAFGPEAVHDVQNASEGASLSLHVYSPPLSTMTYYDVGGDQLVELAPRQTVEVMGPEPDGIDLSGSV